MTLSKGVPITHIFIGDAMLQFVASSVRWRVPSVPSTKERRNCKEEEEVALNGSKSITFEKLFLLHNLYMV